MARGVTRLEPSASSIAVRLRCPDFHACTPPGFTILMAYPPVASSIQAA